MYFVCERQCKNRSKQSPAEEPAQEKDAMCKSNPGDCDAAVWVHLLVALYLGFPITFGFYITNSNKVNDM